MLNNQRRGDRQKHIPQGRGKLDGSQSRNRKIGQERDQRLIGDAVIPDLMVQGQKLSLVPDLLIPVQQEGGHILAEEIIHPESEKHGYQCSGNNDKDPGVFDHPIPDFSFPGWHVCYISFPNSLTCEGCCIITIGFESLHPAIPTADFSNTICRSGKSSQVSLSRSTLIISSAASLVPTRSAFAHSGK